MINTGNITIGTHLGFSWIYYSICVSGGTPSTFTTPGNPPSPAANPNPPGGLGVNWVEMIFAGIFGGVIVLLILLAVPAYQKWSQKDKTRE